MGGVWFGGSGSRVFGAGWGRFGGLVPGWAVRAGGVPVYPIGGYVGILGVGADRGEKGVSTRVKTEARLH